MRRLLTVFIACILLSPSFAHDWKLRKSESGIEVFTRPAENSSFEEFKGVVLIPNTTLMEVLEVILDVKNYPKLFPDCSKAKVLTSEGAYQQTYYLEIDAPWPVKDRYGIYNSVTVISEDGNAARVSLTPSKRTSKAEKNLLKLGDGSGFWEIKKTKGSSMKVTYQFRGEPGGNIPAWLANSSVVSNPYQTLLNLIGQLNKMQGI